MVERVCSAQSILSAIYVLPSQWRNSIWVFGDNEPTFAALGRRIVPLLFLDGVIHNERHSNCTQSGHRIFRIYSLSPFSYYCVYTRAFTMPLFCDVWHFNNNLTLKSHLVILCVCDGFSTLSVLLTLKRDWLPPNWLIQSFGMNGIY